MKALERVRKSSIFVVCSCLSPVLEKIAQFPGNLTPEYLAPPKLPHAHFPRKITTKNYFASLRISYFVLLSFCPKFKVNFSQYIFLLIRIKFFYDSLFPYPIMLGFQLHVAK